MCQYWDNRLTSILTILLTCPNSDTVLCYGHLEAMSVVSISETYSCEYRQIIVTKYFRILIYVGSMHVHKGVWPTFVQPVVRIWTIT